MAVMLDFSGVTETGSGFQVGGVPASIGTPFTVWVSIDDTNAASGIYPILDVQGSLGGTSFTTSGVWDNEPLHAVQEVGGIFLSNTIFGDATNSSGETFLVDLRILGAGVLATDPTTWFGTGPLGYGDSFGESDIFVSSSITNVDISTYQPYEGTLYLESTVVPLPPALYLFCSALLGLIGISRRKKSA